MFIIYYIISQKSLPMSKFCDKLPNLLSLVLHFTFDSTLMCEPEGEVLRGQAHEATSMLYAFLNFGFSKR